MKIDKYNFFAFASNWLFLIAIVSPFAYSSVVLSIEEQKVEKFSKFHQYFIDQSNRFITNADFPYQNLYLNIINNNKVEVRQVFDFAQFISTSRNPKLIFSDENIISNSLLVDSKSIQPSQVSQYENIFSSDNYVKIYFTDDKGKVNKNETYIVFNLDGYYLENKVARNLSFIFNDTNYFAITYYKGSKNNNVFSIGTNKGLYNFGNLLSPNEMLLINQTFVGRVDSDDYARKIFFTPSGSPIFYKDIGEFGNSVKGKDWVSSSKRYLWANDDIDYYNRLNKEAY
tara:strand:- start:865 stop:1719 length:855 start_codon:yes stop_codon:yes gene_type:complete